MTSAASQWRQWLRQAAGTVALLALPGQAWAAPELKAASLEELMNVEVTSVSKVEEKRAGAAAAIHVITGEDIRRSGSTHFPDALRLAPGIHVAQRDANEWSMGARGFSSTNSAKMLVLVDGRSLYTPLVSGVFWEAQGTLLEDVDRIEVIRGPGASLWGSNAVNAVINIQTKHSRDTHGLYAEAGAGTEERGFGAVRYGGKVTEKLHYRVYGQYSDRGPSFDPDGTSTDDWRMGRLGIRSDWDATAQDSLSLEGGFYRGRIGLARPSITVAGRPPPDRDKADVGGGHLQASWRHIFSPSSDLRVRAYFDRTRRDDPSFYDSLYTYNLDMQHRFELPPGQELLYGLTLQLMSNRNVGKGVFALDPPQSEDVLVSGFVQDQLSLLEGKLRLTLGTKLEHNSFSGFELQPSGRFALLLHPAHTVWGAVSRAVRVPTRFERDISIDVSDPAADPLVRLTGAPEFGSEKLVAYELGYRWQVVPSLFLDLAGFFNRYTDLSTLELGEAQAVDGRTLLPLRAENAMTGRAYGGEAVVTWAPLPQWRLTGSWSRLHLLLSPEKQDINRSKAFEGATPRNQLMVQSYLDLPHGFRLDGVFRYLDELTSNVDSPVRDGVEGFFNLDARLAWQAGPGFELSVVGKNLLEARHQEHPDGTLLERAVFAKVAWRGL